MKIIIIVCEDFPGLSFEHLCASLETRGIVKTDDIGCAVSFVPKSIYFDQHDYNHELIQMAPNNFTEKLEIKNFDSFRKNREETINLIIEARNQPEPFDFCFEPIKEYQKKKLEKIC
ncbi:MAG: hypothetical protein ACOYMB_01980 [Patescibacteria group bacterium]